MAQVWPVQVATPSKDMAAELIKGAVEQKLAAGGQVVGPVTSAFWHLGEFGTGEEWQAILKTTDARYPELEKYIVDNHEWTNPEITAIPLVAGLTPYLEWVERATT